MKTTYRQHGATLITALVMLVVLTLLVISAIKSSTTNLRIAGNMQTEADRIAAGQQSIEQVISDNFTAAPAASSVTVPIGGTNYTASVQKPNCKDSIALLNNTPNIPAQCVSSSTVQNSGIFFAASAANTATSWCYAQQWEVISTATDPMTGSATTVHQGVNLIVPAGTTCS